MHHGWMLVMLVDAGQYLEIGFLVYKIFVILLAILWVVAMVHKCATLSKLHKTENCWYTQM